MSEWQESSLGEQINLKRGYDLPSKNRSEGKIPIFSSSGISGYHSKKMIDGPGVITGRYGTIGQVFYSQSAYWPLNTTLYVQDFKENNAKFIYYFLQRLDWEKYSDKSAVPGVNRNDVHQERVTIPCVSEQKAIAAVLSSLDDKIDLLHRQNKTLEAMAETLFRQWFVEEAQDDWEEGTLADYADHLKVCVNPANKPIQLYTHYSLPSFDSGMRPIVEAGSKILSNKYAAQPWTILVSKLNPRFPRIWPIGGRPGENAICSSEFQVFKPKDEKLYGYLYFLLKSNEAKEELSTSASGTSGSHQRVRPADILNLKINLPSTKLAEQYSEFIMPNIKKLMANLEQIHTLEILRNTLLPKLMSGEVRVTV